MRIGILGSGDVGKQLGSALIKIGHEVRIGTRDVLNLKEWVEKNGLNASVGSFAGSAEFGEIIFICSLWSATNSIIKMAGKENFSGKIVIDVTNPLDISNQGAAPKLISSPGNSAGEQVQKWLPESKVVKAFNSIGNSIMVSPKRKEGNPTFFICGNEEGKTVVGELAMKLGWKDIADMGDIDNSYLLECLAMVWIVYGFRNDSWTQALKLLRK